MKFVSCDCPVHGCIGITRHASAFVIPAKAGIYFAFLFQPPFNVEYGMLNYPHDNPDASRRNNTGSVVPCFDKGEMGGRRIYGGEDFSERFKKRYGIDALIKPKSRPKNEKNDDK